MGRLCCYVAHRDRSNKAIATSGDIEKEPIAVPTIVVRGNLCDTAVDSRRNVDDVFVCIVMYQLARGGYCFAQTARVFLGP